MSLLSIFSGKKPTPHRTSFPTDNVYKDLEAHIAKIQRKKRRFARSYRISKMITFLFGGAITVLTGWQIDTGENPPILANLVLIFGASVAIIAGADGVFSWKQKAESYDLLLFELRRLNDRMLRQFDRAPDEYRDQLESHFLEYQKVIEAQKGIIIASYSDDD